MPHSTGNAATDDASAFRLLANQRRIHVLDALDAHGGEMAFDDLAVEVASLENERGTLSDDRIAHVRTSLFHNHLPKLDDAGVVAFDVEGQQIAFDRERRVDDLLEILFE